MRPKHASCTDHIFIRLLQFIKFVLLIDTSRTLVHGFADPDRLKRDVSAFFFRERLDIFILFVNEFFKFLINHLGSFFFFLHFVFIFYDNRSGCIVLHNFKVSI
jgi:hypothetical protein